MAWNPSVLSSQALTSAAWQAEGSLTTGPRVMLSARMRLLAPPPNYSKGRKVQNILTFVLLLNVLLEKNLCEIHYKPTFITNGLFQNCFQIINDHK